MPGLKSLWARLVAAATASPQDLREARAAPAQEVAQEVAKEAPKEVVEVSAPVEPTQGPVSEDARLDALLAAAREESRRNRPRSPLECSCGEPKSRKALNCQKCHFRLIAKTG